MMDTLRSNTVPAGIYLDVLVTKQREKAVQDYKVHLSVTVDENRVDTQPGAGDAPTIEDTAKEFKLIEE